MSAPYATPTQLTDWLPAGTAVDEPERLLARASTRIDEAVLARYAVDEDGLPTDPDVAERLAEATCAQVEQWIEVDEANDIDGLAGTHVSVTGYAGKRAPRLAPRAYDILHQNGFLNSCWLDTSSWEGCC